MLFERLLRRLISIQQFPNGMKTTPKHDSAIQLCAQLVEHIDIPVDELAEISDRTRLAGLVRVVLVASLDMEGAPLEKCLFRLNHWNMLVFKASESYEWVRDYVTWLSSHQRPIEAKLIRELALHCIDHEQVADLVKWVDMWRSLIQDHAFTHEEEDFESAVWKFLVSQSPSKMVRKFLEGEAHARWADWALEIWNVDTISMRHFDMILDAVMKSRYASTEHREVYQTCSPFVRALRLWMGGTHYIIASIHDVVWESLMMQGSVREGVFEFFRRWLNDTPTRQRNSQKYRILQNVASIFQLLSDGAQTKTQQLDQWTYGPFGNGFDQTVLENPSLVIETLRLRSRLMIGEFDAYIPLAEHDSLKAELDFFMDLKIGKLTGVECHGWKGTLPYILIRLFLTTGANSPIDPAIVQIPELQQILTLFRECMGQPKPPPTTLKAITGLALSHSITTDIISVLPSSLLYALESGLMPLGVALLFGSDNIVSRDNRESPVSVTDVETLWASVVHQACRNEQILHQKEFGNMDILVGVGPATLIRRVENRLKLAEYHRVRGRINQALILFAQLALHLTSISDGNKDLWIQECLTGLIWCCDSTKNYAAAAVLCQYHDAWNEKFVLHYLKLMLAASGTRVVDDVAEFIWDPTMADLVWYETNGESKKLLGACRSNRSSLETFIGSYLLPLIQ